jgi:hypothetical protein
MALKAIVLSTFMFGILRGLGAALQPSENSQASANELVRKIIANEIKAEAEDHSHWAFQLQTEKSGRRELDQVVETKDGNLQRPVCVNGRPLREEYHEFSNPPHRLPDFFSRMYHRRYRKGKSAKELGVCSR